MGRKALSPPKADCRAAQDAAAGVLETGEGRYFLRRCSIKRNALHQEATSRRGAVIGVFVAVTLAGLLGFGALAIDIGHMGNVAAETQNAVDAAALAGASLLPG